MTKPSGQCVQLTRSAQTERASGGVFNSLEKRSEEGGKAGCVFKWLKDQRSDAPAHLTTDPTYQKIIQVQVGGMLNWLADSIDVGVDEKQAGAALLTPEQVEPTARFAPFPTARFECMTLTTPLLTTTFENPKPRLIPIINDTRCNQRLHPDPSKSRHSRCPIHFSLS